MGLPDLLQPNYWTADMVRALPDDGRRYEVVYGELLVTPSPGILHQRVARRLSVALALYLESEQIGEVFFAPADIGWDDATLVQPDVFVAPLKEARTLNWARLQSLLLVAEILSPSTVRQDRFAKRLRYQQAGISLYWIVDPEMEVVEVWTPTDRYPRVERQVLKWQPAGANHPFLFALRDLFRPV